MKVVKACAPASVSQLPRKSQKGRDSGPCSNGTWHGGTGPPTRRVVPAHTPTQCALRKGHAFVGRTTPNHLCNLMQSQASPRLKVGECYFLPSFMRLLPNPLLAFSTAGIEHSAA